MSLHLDESHLNIVKNILQKYGLKGETYAFGSRVRGDHHRYSDLDLVLKRVGPIETDQLVKVKNEFEESDLPITVDLIEWVRISEDFKKNIQDDLIAI